MHTGSSAGGENALRVHKGVEIELRDFDPMAEVSLSAWG